MTPIVNAPLWPVPITTAGQSCGGTVVYTRGGKLHVTCIVKSTFHFVPDDRMQLIQPEEIVLSDISHGDDPDKSIWAACEAVPFLSRVDVVLTGHAYAPVGQTVPSHSVRLAIHRDDGLLLDKTLHVYGDRTDSTLEPFERMPLVYERTYGGVGFSYNPHGTGMILGSSYPNIVHPLDPAAVAGFAPLSYEMRLARLTSVEHPRIIDPLVWEVPVGMDEAYFHSAPADQILDSLQGQEWIEVDGMHPQLQRLVSRLPGIRGIAKFYGIQPEKPDGVRTIALRPDIVRIDADRMVCSVIFRATVSLRDGRSLQTLRIAAGVETEDVAIAHLLTPPPMPGAELSPANGAPEPENVAPEPGLVAPEPENVAPAPENVAPADESLAPEIDPPLPQAVFSDFQQVSPGPEAGSPARDFESPALEFRSPAQTFDSPVPTFDSPRGFAVSSEVDDASLTGEIVTNPQLLVASSRVSITDEVTLERTVEIVSIQEEVTLDRTFEVMAARNVAPARISTPEIIHEEDTATQERPLTKAEMERIAAISKQLERNSQRESNGVREEKSTLTLDIDFSEFDSL